VIDCIIQRNGAICNDILERLAVIVGHHNKWLIGIRAANLVDYSYVWMIKRRNRPGFVNESLLGVFVPAKHGGQKFERNGSLQYSVRGTVYNTHATLA